MLFTSFWWLLYHYIYHYSSNFNGSSLSGHFGMVPIPDTSDTVSIEGQLKPASPVVIDGQSEIPQSSVTQKILHL